jgi:HK97 gp10 family phage protein
MSSVKLINNIPKFINKLKSNKQSALEAIGESCKNNMDKNVPVDTGNLKSHNKYQVSNDEVKLINDCEYAGYIEFGTRKMRSQPFFKSSALNNIGELTNIVGGKLSNGIK